MSKSKRKIKTVKCHDAGDGTGDIIVELPGEVLAEMGLCLGDELTIEQVDGAIVLKPNRKTHQPDGS